MASILTLVDKYNYLDRFKISTKLAMASFLSIGLILILVMVLAIEALSDYRTVKMRQSSTDIFPSLYDAMKAIQVVRGRTNSTTNSAELDSPTLVVARNEASSAIAKALSVTEGLALYQPVNQAITQVQRDFERINQSIASTSKQVLFGEYTSLVASIQEQIWLTADLATLLHDDVMDVYFLMEYMVHLGPNNIEAVGVLRGLGSGIISRSEYSLNSLIPFSQNAGQLDLLAAIELLQESIAENPRLASDLEPLIRKLEQDTSDFLTTVNSIVSQQRSSLSSEAFFALGTAVNNDFYAVAEVANAWMATLLGERAEALITRLVIMSVFIAVLLLTTIYVLLSTGVSITSSVRKTKHILERVASGDLSKQLEIHTQDEFSELAQSLNSTQSQLAAGIEAERIAAAEINKIKTALDSASTSLCLIDTDHCINYSNGAMSMMIERHNEQLKERLHYKSSTELIGCSILGMYDDSSATVKRLLQLDERTELNVQLSGLTFTVTETPFYDEKGGRSGTILEWEDITEALKIQQEQSRIAEENARIKQALDNVSTNTMIADHTRKIVYMNKAIERMFIANEHELKKALPHFDVQAIVGQSIDIFHKNPAHQTNLLDHMVSAHEAEITVMGLTFALTANPVFDDAGKRIGTVVEWVDRTEEVALEQQISALIQASAHGNLDERLPTEGKSGFFKVLSEGLNNLVAIADRIVKDTGRVFSALSHGDLSQSITSEYEGAFATLKNDANATVMRLSEIITQIREAASTVTTAADEIAQGNTDLSQRTEEQASSLEETASSMEQMTSAVKSSADSAKEANLVAQNAERLAANGGTVVKNAVTAMAEINDSSKHIADIISVIDEIAFQTNLLALNAAVEAARAGEQGRGFAVVASEVRNLAQRSAQAAKEIKDLIRDSVDKVENGSKLVNESGDTLLEIVKSVRSVSSMVESISTSALEQSSGIEQVNKAVSQMDEMTQQNAALVEEASAAAEAMAEQARRLLQQVSFFSLSHDEMPVMVSPTNTAVSEPKALPKAPIVKPSEPNNTEKAVVSRGAEVFDDDDDWQEF